MKLRSTILACAALSLAFAGTSAFAHDPDDYGNYSPIFIPPPGEGGSVDSPLLFDVNVTIGGGLSKAEHNRNAGIGVAGSNLDDHKWPFLNGDARISVPLTDKVSMQFDMGGFANITNRGNVNGRDQGEDQAQNFFYAGTHINHRNPEVGSVGLFGLLGSAAGGEPENAVVWAGGLEGERYFGNLTTYGQWGWMDSDDGTNADSLGNAWLLRGGVRYYLDDYTRFVFDYQFAEGNENNDVGSANAEIEAQTFSIRFEKQCKHRPITWYAGYQQTKVDGEDGPPYGTGTTEQVRVDSFITGVSIGIGASNLKQRERRGAGGSMPNVGEWAAWTIESVE